jgi:hypothetical protein
MTSHFQMSLMGEMSFFLGLQVKQSPEGIFINQSKYVADILKRFNMQDHQPAGLTSCFLFVCVLGIKLILGNRMR